MRDRERERMGFCCHCERCPGLFEKTEREREREKKRESTSFSLSVLLLSKEVTLSLLIDTMSSNKDSETLILWVSDTARRRR